MHYPPAPATRRRPGWPPWLTLLLLAPLFGEVVCGPTPLVGANPVAVVFDLCLYGAGAIVIREVARRRGLGWTSIWILGAAYGVVEEGLVITSWFNPYWPDAAFLHGYSRLAGVNWQWATLVTVYHATASISIPILLAEAIHPGAAGAPWLGLDGLATAAAVFLTTCVAGLALAGFMLFAAAGYSHPPPAYALALAAAAGLVALGLRPPRRPAPAQDRPAWGRWRLRVLGAAAAAAHLGLGYGAPSLGLPAVLPIADELALVAVMFALLRHQSARPGWSARSALAVAEGIVAAFLVRDLSPVTGSVKPLAVLAGLAVLVLAERNVAARTGAPLEQPVG